MCDGDRGVARGACGTRDVADGVRGWRPGAVELWVRSSVGGSCRSKRFEPQELIQSHYNFLLDLDLKGKMRSAVLLAPVIITTIAVVGTVAAVILYKIPERWLTALNVGVSAILTAALVSLYYGQISVLQSQEDLKRTEINMEIRKQHTEALRKRVAAWHGNTEPTQMSDNPLPVPRNDDERGLPRANSTGFSSAPGEVDVAVPFEDREFDVVPIGLQDDPFLDDFVNNHANDVNKCVKSIERHQAKFDSLRSQFVDSLDLNFGPVDESYEIEWASGLPIWVFSELLRFAQRTDNEEKPQERHQNISNYVKYMSDTVQVSGVQPQKNSFTLRHRTDGPVVAIVKLSELEMTDIGEIKQDVISYFESRFQLKLESVVEEWPDQTVARALRELQQGEEAIEELEQKLEEYAGRPIYDGDCKYINNADVSNW